MLGAVLAWAVASFVPGPAVLGFVAAVVIAPALVGTLAAATDGLILKRLNYDPEATIVATIGLLYMVEQATLSVYGPNANPVAAPFEWRIQLPWFGYSGYKLFVILAAALVLLALRTFLTRTRAGLIMRATQVDRTTARAFGINVDRVYMGTFALGAGLAALAGVLIVPISQAHYLMGGDPLLLSFIVVIIGGLGSLRGTLIAALVIGLSDGVISMFFTPTLAKILATLLVAMVLVFRPQGLFGAKA
jgi:branched-chain amino acid transport system permease protein